PRREIAGGMRRPAPRLARRLRARGARDARSAARRGSAGPGGHVLSLPGPGGPEAVNTGTGRDYEENAFHISQGKRFYTWFNCVGCHGNGGGGSGPALMDDAWIYGSAIENIAATIREGRPNGMPS